MENMNADAEKKLERALSRLDTEMVDIDDEAQRLLAVAKVARESFIRDITETRGWPPSQWGEAQAKVFKELTMAFSTVVKACDGLDKSRERRASKMKKEDYLKAATALIQGLDPKERAIWLRAMVNYHATVTPPGGPPLPQVASND